MFRCDFESYRGCGLEQQQDDELDWELIQSERRVDNVPDVDHTLGTRQGQSHRIFKQIFMISIESTLVKALNFSFEEQLKKEEQKFSETLDIGMQEYQNLISHLCVR